MQADEILPPRPQLDAEELAKMITRMPKGQTDEVPPVKRFRLNNNDHIWLCHRSNDSLTCRFCEKIVTGEEVLARCDELHGMGPCVLGDFPERLTYSLTEGTTGVASE
jgi:hypothetical protein